MTHVTCTRSTISSMIQLSCTQTFVLHKVDDGADDGDMLTLCRRYAAVGILNRASLTFLLVFFLCHVNVFMP